MRTDALEYQAVENAPKAKTNVLRLSLSDLELIHKLVLGGTQTLRVDYFKREFTAKPGETTEQYYKRVHGEARRILLATLEVPNDTEVKYEVMQLGRMFYFFFLAPTQADSVHLLDDISNSSIPVHRLVSALLSLHVKLDLLQRAQEQYELDSAYHNAAVFVGTDVRPSKKDGIVVLDTFEVRIYYSQYRELVTTLHNQTFQATKAASVQTPLEETVLSFRVKSAAYGVHEKLDARLYGRKKFMRFQAEYPGCLNHAQTLVARSVARVLDRIGVAPEPVTFQASAAWDSFITAASATPRRMVIVVDNYGDYASEDVQISVRRQLTDELGNCTFIAATDIQEYDSLSTEFNYLFLNKGVGRKGNSIRSGTTGRNFNSFWQAYKHHREGKPGEFDLYTRMKIAHFEHQRPVVMQGLDLPETLSARDGSYLNPNITEKIRKELWLKESAFHSRTVSDLHLLPTGAYIFIYIRRPEGLFYASVISCRLAADSIVIEEQTTFSDEDKLRFAYPMLNRAEKLFDQSFYLHDTLNSVTLTAYTNGRVPQIVGNAGFDNVERFSESGDTLRKLTPPALNPLPYYVSPRLRGQYHHVFVAQTETDFLYFVSPKGNPQSTYATQSRIYSILVWDANGAFLRQSDSPLTSTFLRSFTDDILQNGQVSKSSILQKLARLYIEN